MQMIDQRRHGHDEERGRGVFNQMADKSVFFSLFSFFNNKAVYKGTGKSISIDFLR